MSDNHHRYPGAEALRRRIMTGHALCAEAANQLRNGSPEQAYRTIQKIRNIIAEAEAIIGGTLLAQRLALKDRLGEVKRSED